MYELKCAIIPFDALLASLNVKPALDFNAIKADFRSYLAQIQPIGWTP